MNHKGTDEEKQARMFLTSLGIDYDKLTPEEFVTQINILKKSRHLKSANNQRGKVGLYPTQTKVFSEVSAPVENEAEAQRRKRLLSPSLNQERRNTPCISVCSRFRM